MQKDIYVEIIRYNVVPKKEDKNPLLKYEMEFAAPNYSKTNQKLRDIVC